MLKKLTAILIFLLFLSGAIIYAFTEQAPPKLEIDKIRRSKIVDGLKHPWSLALLPNGNGDFLISERGGSLRLFHQGELSPPLAGVPEVLAVGQGGLLDIALHPDFIQNAIIYLSYSKLIGDLSTTALFQARLDIDRLQLQNGRDLFIAQPAWPSTHHYGSRLVFGHDGKLYMSIGDRGQKMLAQDNKTHMGTIIRINADGSIPTDNPFIGDDHALDEIYSYGHRNPQGIAVQKDGTILINEHGPKGGDEINEIQAGRNYGWPIITYGRAYSGLTIGEGQHKAGMEQPLWHWTPSIAPSGLAIYHGDIFPEWVGNILVGSLKFSYLERQRWHNQKVQERRALIKNKIGRVRDVRISQNGDIYVINDEPSAAVYKLSHW